MRLVVSIFVERKGPRQGTVALSLSLPSFPSPPPLPSPLAFDRLSLQTASSVTASRTQFPLSKSIFHSNFPSLSLLASSSSSYSALRSLPVAFAPTDFSLAQFSARLSSSLSVQSQQFKQESFPLPRLKSNSPVNFLNPLQSHSYKWPISSNSVSLVQCSK